MTSRESTLSGQFTLSGVLMVHSPPPQGDHTHYLNLTDAVELGYGHIVKLAGAAVDDVRRRVQQETLGHRGRKGDPLYGIRHLLRAGRERLTSRQQNRLASAFAAHPDHVAVEVAYKCAQDVREVFHQPTLPRGRRLAEQLIQKLPSCPIPEIARLGKTLRRWRTAFLAYFDTDGASNGGTKAINGFIELGRRIARGFRASSTTAFACSSSPAASTPHPTLNSEDPAHVLRSVYVGSTLDPG